MKERKKSPGCLFRWWKRNFIDRKEPVPQSFKDKHWGLDGEWSWGERVWVYAKPKFSMLLLFLSCLALFIFLLTHPAMFLGFSIGLVVCTMLFLITQG